MTNKEKEEQNIRKMRSADKQTEVARSHKLEHLKLQLKCAKDDIAP